MSDLYAITEPEAGRRPRLSALLCSIFRYWKTQALIRRDMNYLRHQPDRILRDIGLLRADLPDDHEFNSNSHRRLWLRHR